MLHWLVELEGVDTEVVDALPCKVVNDQLKEALAKVLAPVLVGNGDPVDSGVRGGRILLGPVNFLVVGVFANDDGGVPDHLVIGL